MKRLVQMLILAGLLAVPAGAAVHMKSRTYGTAANDKPNEALDMSFEGWFKDDKAVVEIIASGNPMYPHGRIFIDGTTMTMHDPEKNTCAPWDLQAMLRFAGAVMNAFGDMVQLEYGDPRVEILEHTKASSMFGLAVDYYKVRSNWDMSFKLPLAKKKTVKSSTLQEVWVSKELSDSLPAFGIFMDKDTFTTGHEETDRAIAASMPPIEGALLKSIAVTQTTNQKGKVETTTTRTDVIELDRSAPDPAGGFSPPADCEMVAAPTGPMPEGGGDAEATDEEGKKPWQKIKVKNPFKKKKDDG